MASLQRCHSLQQLANSSAARVNARNLASVCAFSCCESPSITHGSGDDVGGYTSPTAVLSGGESPSPTPMPSETSGEDEGTDGTLIKTEPFTTPHIAALSATPLHKMRGTGHVAIAVGTFPSPPTAHSVTPAALVTPSLTCVNAKDDEDTMEVYCPETKMAYQCPRHLVVHSGRKSGANPPHSSGISSATGSNSNGNAQRFIVCPHYNSAMEQEMEASQKNAPNGSPPLRNLYCRDGSRCTKVHIDVPLSTIKGEMIHVHYVYRDEALCQYERLSCAMTRELLSEETSSFANTGHTSVTPQSIADKQIMVAPCHDTASASVSSSGCTLVPASRVVMTAGARVAFRGAWGCHGCVSTNNGCSPTHGETNTTGGLRVAHCAYYYYTQTCNRGASCDYIHVVSVDPTQERDSIRPATYRKRLQALGMMMDVVPISACQTPSCISTSPSPASLSLASPSMLLGRSFMLHKDYPGGGSSVSQSLRRSPSVVSLVSHPNGPSHWSGIGACVDGASPKVSYLEAARKGRVTEDAFADNQQDDDIFCPTAEATGSGLAATRAKRVDPLRSNQYLSSPITRQSSTQSLGRSSVSIWSLSPSTAPMPPLQFHFNGNGSSNTLAGSVRSDVGGNISPMLAQFARMSDMDGARVGTTPTPTTVSGIGHSNRTNNAANATTTTRDRTTVSTPDNNNISTALSSSRTMSVLGLSTRQPGKIPAGHYVHNPYNSASTSVSLRMSQTLNGVGGV